MPGIYRNDGAPWTRPDGTRIRKGAEFIPTPDEKARKAYKLRYLRPSEPEGAPEPTEAPPERDDVEDYAVGGGWYLIEGKKVQGRTNALTRLHEMEASGG